VDAAVGKGDTGRICGVVYQHFNRLVAPWPTWSTNVAWDAAAGAAYVAVSKFQRREVAISICRVTPKDPTGVAFANSLFADNKNLPKATPPLAQIRKTLSESDPCAVIEVRMLVEPRHLLLHLDRRLEDCEPLRFRVDLQSGEVTEVTLDEKPLGPAS
jgi:hypothetical protein